MKNGINITEPELRSIISSESVKFKKRISKELLGKKIAQIALSVAGKVDSSLENADIVGVLQNHFVNSISKTMKPGLVNSLENGGIGTNFAEEIGSMINKYVAQEAYYRSNDLKKKYGVGTSLNDTDRKDIIADIDKTFESTDLQLELSESFNDEYNGLVRAQEEQIIDESVKEIKNFIDDAEQKAEVTRTIINEFKEVSEKAKDEQEALKPADVTPPVDDGTPPIDDSKGATGSTESKIFDSTEFIKSKIPVTAERFSIENDNGSFTKKKLMDILFTLEEESNSIVEDREYVNKRIKSIYNDAVTVKDFDISKVEDLEKTFDSAIKDVDTAFSAYRMIGLNVNSDEAAFKADKDTLDIIGKMSNLVNKDENDNVNDTEILSISSNVKPVTSVEEFIDMAFDNFQLKTAKPETITDYDEYKKATEVRDTLMAEFLIDGMKHIPEARAQRVKELSSGLKKLAGTDAIEYLNSKRIKSIYYKTAKIADPGIFVDFKVEADRVKEMISKAYSTDKYDSLVDDFFVNNKINGKVSEENYFEMAAFKATMDISKESENFSSEENRVKIKSYGKIFASYLKTLEATQIISKRDVAEYARTISMK